MNYSRMDIIQDMQTCLGLARSVSPYKSGNLRFNAMSAYQTNDGFAIRYSLADAFYIYFQEEGTRYTTKNQGFIVNRTLPLLATYLLTKYVQEDSQATLALFKMGYFGNIDQVRTRGWSQNANKREIMAERQENNYQSRLANMIVQGHMSNVFKWRHNENIEQAVPSAFQKR